MKTAKSIKATVKKLASQFPNKRVAAEKLTAFDVSLTVSQWAELLGCAKSTIRRNSGDIEGYVSRSGFHAE